MSWLRRLGLLAYAVLLAIVFNFLRIVGIALVASHTNLSYTLIHEGLGTLVYLAGLLLIWFLV